ncbi:winged helix-turn-helix domain-containing protein [Paraburkholderia fungorum]|nr:winged helix-turn-helix domain-containing protein [Paraburkholderia fungorum]
MTRLEEKLGIRVHRNTLNEVLKRAGLVWKRTRHRLKKRDGQRFQEAQFEMEALIQRA